MTKIPGRYNLIDERFLLAYGLEEHSLSQQRRHGGICGSRATCGRDPSHHGRPGSRMWAELGTRLSEVPYLVTYFSQLGPAS